MAFTPTAPNHLINEMRLHGATVIIDPKRHTITARMIQGNNTINLQASFGPSALPVIQNVYRQFMAALAGSEAVR